MAETPECISEFLDRDLDAIECENLDGDGEFLVDCLGDRIVPTGVYTILDQWKGTYVDLNKRADELTRMRVALDQQR